MKKFTIGLQLYNVRDVIEGDLDGTLAAVKAMGYDYVECASTFYGLDAVAFKAKLAQHGLTPLSSHFGIDGLLEGPRAENIKYHRDIGCKYIAIPWLGEQYRATSPDFPQTVKLISEIGRDVKAAGMALLYHNHDFEFQKVDGKYALDILYSSVPADLLQAEFDTCWIKFAGVDPAEYMRQYAGRCPVVHLKDYAMPDGKFEFRAVGSGIQDIPAIVQASEDIGASALIVEQDQPTPGMSSLECAESSRKYLQSLGL